MQIHLRRRVAIFDCGDKLLATIDHDGNLGRNIHSDHPASIPTGYAKDLDTLGDRAITAAEFQRARSDLRPCPLHKGALQEATVCDGRSVARTLRFSFLEFRQSNITSIGDNISMAKSRGNSNWGKPDTGGPVEVSPTSFEQIVEQFGLSPDQYVKSVRLREWARTNKNSKFIPESLLKAWGLSVDSSE